MAKLFKPPITEYVLKDSSGKLHHRTADGERVTKNTPGSIANKKTASKWYGRYTDGNGGRHVVPLSENKDVARRKLAKLAGDAQLAGVGLADPFADHRARPLLEHVGDFERDLRAKGNTIAHCEKASARVRQILRACQLLKFDDLQSSGAGLAISEYLASLRNDRALPALPESKTWYTVAEAAAVMGILPGSLRHQLAGGPPCHPPPDRRPGQEQRLHKEAVGNLLARQRRGIGISTSNGLLGAVKQFSKWLVRMRRAPFDPLAHMPRMNAKTDERHIRRPLASADLAHFAEVVAEQRPFRGLSGPDRLLLYLTAFYTGFRASRLASLTPGSFDLKASPATVTVKAAYSKHRRNDVQPIRTDLAEMIAGYIAGKDRNKPLWPGTWPLGGAAMLRRDLAAAGIPYEDENGQVLDFHGLRHTFLSALAESGVHPKVAQILARHSSITLTMDRYTHLERIDVAKGLDNLPKLPATGKQEKRGRA